MIHELRLVVTADDYDEAVAFYRDVLGMRQLEFWTSPDGGQVVLLDAGRATLEISDAKNSAWVDEVEVGRRVGAHIRVALEVDDSRAATAAAVDGGAELVSEPIETPWRSLNARLEAPGGLQLTLFEELGAAE
jgi:catechol 2,3-dioxygenase-like lactoylglutathione lyase family enzyme